MSLRDPYGDPEAVAGLVRRIEAGLVVADRAAVLERASAQVKKGRPRGDALQATWQWRYLLYCWNLLKMPVRNRLI